MMKRFYQFTQQANVQLSYDDVPEIYITMFEAKGLKKRRCDYWWFWRMEKG
jgi:hypothetical protein